MWRVRPLTEGPAEQLLDEGVAALDALQDDPTPTLRWYRATQPVIVLGRGQQARWFDAAHLPIVGRFSGGGAVLMDQGLLSLDVIVPADHPLLGLDMTTIFTNVGAAWGNALSALGVPDVRVHRGPSTTPRATTDRDRLIAAICYATLGSGEVTSAGRKIVGLAQRRRRYGALVQCGLLRHWDPTPLLRALRADVDDQQILEAATGLDDIVDSPIRDQEIMRAVEEALGG